MLIPALVNDALWKRSDELLRFPMSATAAAEDEPGLKRVIDETRQSLIERLADWEDRRSWDEFYQTYWRLIHSMAMKAGLRQDEAFDVVQETILTIARQQQKKGPTYDPQKGSFKNWLLNVTRWRIADQFRKRARELRADSGDEAEDGPRTGELERYADPDGPDLEKEWDAEWNRNLTRAALHRVKNRVSPRQFQIFDCYVVKGWDTAKVAQSLDVSVAQVYLARHRVGKLVKKEIEELQHSLL